MQDTNVHIAQDTVVKELNSQDIPALNTKPAQLPKRKYRTLKRKQLLRAIPTSKTLREAAQKAGYSDISGNIYRQDIKQHIDKHFNIDKQGILTELQSIISLCKTDGDVGNIYRGIENICKIMGHFAPDTLLIQAKQTDEYNKLTILDKLRRIKDLHPKEYTEVYKEIETNAI